MDKNDHTVSGGITMTNNHTSEYGNQRTVLDAIEIPPQELKPTPFPTVRIEDESIIDEILNTLREEEKSAHA